MENEIWHTMSVSQVLERLQTDREAGLSRREHAERLKRVGANAVLEGKKPGWFEILSRQFKDFMVSVLLVAAAISALLGELTDTAAILAIVFLNAILGFVQEYRAESSLDALRKLTSPEVTVIRSGSRSKVPAEAIVPGDIIEVESGERLCADCRLIEATCLEVDESSLTGESVPVVKEAGWTGHPGTGLGDRRNMLYAGTAITRGRGLAAVVATGQSTQIGRIAQMIQSVDTKSPLEQRLDALGRQLVAICLFVVALVFVAGVLRGYQLTRMFMLGVSLAVAAIPEGLPAIVTLSLALGVQRMAKRKAIVRRLSAVEALGCTTVICSDKTGTLTQNHMIVRQVWLPGHGNGNGERGRIGGQRRRTGDVTPVVLYTAVLCNSAHLGKKNGRFRRQETGQTIGDPMEVALLEFARDNGLEKDEVRRRLPVIGELPFDASRRRMSVLVGSPVPGVSHPSGQTIGFASLLTKGAPETIMERCSRIRIGSAERPLDAKERMSLLERVDSMAANGLRVIGFAYKRIPLTPTGLPGGGLTEALERDMVFVGLVGFVDPIRPEVVPALHKAESAGVRTIMLTGDHARTAQTVGAELGLLGPGDEVITGDQLESMSDEHLRAVLSLKRGRGSVFARVSPEHKLRIIRQLKATNNVVAMTGDGVNDAPAVREADVGISMGLMGTDVTREASSIVLADDNYATIVGAIEEGRGIYDNIKRFIKYLLGCNVGEVLTMFLAVLAGMPFPLAPLQILWMNLVTDGLPALALGSERPGDDVMNRPPRDTDEKVLSGEVGFTIVIRGLSICAVTLLGFCFYVSGVLGDPLKAQTVAFTTLVVSQLFYALECGTAGRNQFTGSWPLYLAVCASAVLQWLAVYHPGLQPVFRTVSLLPYDWCVVVGLSAAGALGDNMIRWLGPVSAGRFRGSMSES